MTTSASFADKLYMLFIITIKLCVQKCQKPVYLAGGFDGFAESTGWWIAVKHVSYELVLSAVHYEAAQTTHRRTHAELTINWFKVKYIPPRYFDTSGLPYTPLTAMLTKISKWSRIEDSFWITPKIESLVVFAISDIPRKFQKDPSITFWVILLTHRQTKCEKNITYLAEVIIMWVNNLPKPKS